ncbi:MAG: FtsX-like permease family protein, partial [Christensenellales bacterium]|jgi:putative ABC transport system permease protein
MQRVAIARALVNDPDILLADEPTGALDSQTSTQVMDIMREIAKDRLVIMVTHNPALAQEYATRTIRLLDGRVTDDSNPHEAAPAPAQPAARVKHTSMQFATALSLSFHNLLTKKTRTLLTAFAGSIGIIGIALILSLSNGIQNYITRVEEDTLSSYPIQIEQQAVDMTGMLAGMMNIAPDGDAAQEGVVRSSNVMLDMFESMQQQVTTNDTAAFKAYLESGASGIEASVSDIKYAYGTTPQIYREQDEGYLQVNPTTVYDSIGLSSEMSGMYASAGGMSVWSELIDNQELLESQYDVIAGRMPRTYDEIVLIVDPFNRIHDFALYSLGLKDQSELSGIMGAYTSGAAIESSDVTFTYDELLALRFKLAVEPDYYLPQAGGWVDQRGDTTYMQNMLDDAAELRVVGILRPNEEAVNTSVTGSVGYTSALTDYIIDTISAAEIVRAQLADPDTDVFTGLPFGAPPASIDEMPLSDAQRAYLESLSEEEIAALAAQFGAGANAAASYEENLRALGVADRDVPTSIAIYPRDFAAKEKVTAMIADYNARMTEAGDDASVIQYTDYVELIMSSVNTIINAISYVLIAFVAISLVVSSIMIGIITYISVLERTKEIGILRSIGASKRDIARVFNAETLVVGFVSGALGILISFALTFPINALIRHLANISGVAQLPALGAAILIAISMFLTWIAGLIPSGIASRKDPVVALRTE